jgi:NAD(P)-dependent dehydrogenase (short-subunit alcohol dehydrogenase family)
MTVGWPMKRTAIVTGAGKRVGRVIAEALLARGWTVVAHVRHEADEVPAGAVKVAAELTAVGAANRIVAAAAGLGELALLVNNAARFAFDSLETFDGAEFDAHMAANVRAPVLLTRAFADAAGEGDRLVVNLLDSKLAAPNPDFLSYTLSKQALAGFTLLAARALAGRGIRVNGIAPALMLRSAGQSEGNFETVHARNPLGRGVTPEDVAAAIAYLVDAPAVTGQVLTLDSGQHFWSLERDVQFMEEE